MADTKISALTAATTPLAGTEVLPIVQSGTTKKVSVANLTAGRVTNASGLIVDGDPAVQVSIGLNTAGNSTASVVMGKVAAGGGTVTNTIRLATYGTSYGSAIKATSDLNATTASALYLQTTPGGGGVPTDRLSIDDVGNVTVNTGNLVIGTANKGINFSSGNGVISVGNASYNIYIGGGAFTPAEIFLQSTYAYIQAAYNNTTASAANVFVASNGELKRSTSALKYKQDIRDVEDFNIDGLRPVRYKSKCEGDDQTKDHFGLIADEAAKAGFEELVTRSETGEIEGFQYERLTVVLLKKIQILESRLAALENE